jgi:hypothetical protein
VKESDIIMIGPTLPPHLQKKKEERTEEEDAQVLNGQDPSTLSPPKSVVSGPQLPPHLHKKQKTTSEENDK